MHCNWYFKEGYSDFVHKWTIQDMQTFWNWQTLAVVTSLSAAALTYEIDIQKMFAYHPYIIIGFCGFFNTWKFLCPSVGLCLKFLNSIPTLHYTYHKSCVRCHTICHSLDPSIRKQNRILTSNHPSITCLLLVEIISNVILDRITISEINKRNKIW